MIIIGAMKLMFGWSDMDRFALRNDRTGIEVRGVVYSSKVDGIWRPSYLYSADGVQLEPNGPLSSADFRSGLSRRSVLEPMWIILYNRRPESILDVEAYTSTSRRPIDSGEIFAGSTRAFARGRSIDRFLIVRPRAPYIHLRIHGDASPWRTIGSVTTPPDVETRTSPLIRRVFSVAFGPGKRVVSSYLGVDGLRRPTTAPMYLGRDTRSCRVISIEADGSRIVSDPITVMTGATDLFDLYIDRHGRRRSTRVERATATAARYEIQVRSEKNPIDFTIRIPDERRGELRPQRQPID